MLLTCHKIDMGQFQDDLSLQIFEDNLERFLKGKELKYIVSYEKGY